MYGALGEQKAFLQLRFHVFSVFFPAERQEKFLKTHNILKIYIEK